MKKIAVFPGSFDPITLGHVSIIKRAMPLFDEIIVAIGLNADKNYMFGMEQRVKWIKEIFKNDSKISVQSYKGLTIDFCKENKANYILRGLRTASDFEFERAIGQVNRSLDPNIETLFLLTESEHSHISSSIVRDVIRHKGNYSILVPKEVSV